jgi:hypothetical protein
MAERDELTPHERILFRQLKYSEMEREKYRQLHEQGVKLFQQANARNLAAENALHDWRQLALNLRRRLSYAALGKVVPGDILDAISEAEDRLGIGGETNG